VREGERDGGIGPLVAHLRRAAGLTQEQLAEKSGLSVRAISSIECGSRHPRPFSLERIALALDLAGPERDALIGAGLRVPAVGAPAAPRLVTCASSYPLIGREGALAEVGDLLLGDGPGLLAIGGEPGIGKSRVLAEALELAQRSAITAMVGACGRGSYPYAPIVDALADYARRQTPSMLAHELSGCTGLEMLLPELAEQLGAGPKPLSGNGSHQQRRLLFDAVTRFLRAVAGSSRVLLVLDDLQWAGPDAADLLAHLTRYAAPRVRILLACRTGDVPYTGRLAECIADLARADQVRRLRLAPLSTVEASRLVTTVAGTHRLPADRRARILRLAGGLPLFLIELTRAAQSDAPDEVPGHLRLAVAQQVAALPEPALALLRRMAALGPAVPLERLAGTGEPLERVLDGLEASRRLGLLDETRAGYRFRFPLIRLLLAQSLGGNRRRLWRFAYAAGRGHA
jgi:transcriptional regulator with XRE-family HTH domain